MDPVDAEIYLRNTYLLRPPHLWTHVLSLLWSFGHFCRFVGATSLVQKELTQMTDGVGGCEASFKSLECFLL